MLLVTWRYLDRTCIPGSMGADLAGSSAVGRFGSAS